MCETPSCKLELHPHAYLQKHPTSTYTCEVTTTLGVCDGYMVIYLNVPTNYMSNKLLYCLSLMPLV